MSKKKKLLWFGVKTAYLSKVNSTKLVLVEERVLLVNAKSHDDAIKIASIEAKEYGNYKYKNTFNKSVKMKLIKAIDSFEIYDKIGNLAEIYSSTRLILNYSESEIKKLVFGETIKGEKKSRKHFQHW